jgi:hypothetical protein
MVAKLRNSCSKPPDELASTLVSKLVLKSAIRSKNGAWSGTAKATAFAVPSRAKRTRTAGARELHLAHSLQTLLYSRSVSRGHEAGAPAQTVDADAPPFFFFFNISFIQFISARSHSPNFPKLPKQIQSGWSYLVWKSMVLLLPG